MHDKGDISFNVYASKSKFLNIESPGHVSHVQVVFVSVASDIWHRAEFTIFHSAHDPATYLTQNQISSAVATKLFTLPYTRNCMSPAQGLSLKVCSHIVQLVVC